MSFSYPAGGYTIVMPPIPADLRAALASCDLATAPEPDCDVCLDLGAVPGASGRHGRPTLPCMNCDAYDRNLQADEDARAEQMSDR